MSIKLHDVLTVQASFKIFQFYFSKTKISTETLVYSSTSMMTVQKKILSSSTVLVAQQQLFSYIISVL
jgi:hypothetical protein